MTTDEFTLRDFDRVKGGVTFRSYPFNPGQSAKAYGAEGDGVTDDTTAVQNAVDGAPQVFFPAGTYLITNLTIPDDVRIVGKDALIVVSGTITFGARNHVSRGAAFDITAATVAGEVPLFDGFNPKHFTAARANAVLDLCPRSRMSIWECGVDDPTGASDQAAALQAAFDTISGRNMVLDLAGGIWRFNSQLTLRDTHGLENGVLRASVTDTGNYETNSCIRVYADTENNSRPTWRNVTLRRMQYTNKIGLQIEKGLRIRFDNLILDSWKASGCVPLRFMGCQGGQFDNLDIDGYGLYGIDFNGISGGAAATTDILFLNARIIDGLASGIALYAPEYATSGAGGMAGCTFIGGGLEDSRGVGIDFDMARRSRFVGFRFDGRLTDATWVNLTNSDNDTQMDATLFDSCSFEAASTAACITIGTNVYETRVRCCKFPATGTNISDSGTNTIISGNVNEADSP